MFSGIGKTASELALAVDEGIMCVNVESEAELELLSSIASSKGRAARVSIRVNPDIDAKTHHKIATGKAENKFGIPISRAREIYARAAKLKGLEVTGVDMHIGSQITELDPFGNAFRAARRICSRSALRRSHDFTCRPWWRIGDPISRRQRAATAS